MRRALLAAVLLAAACGREPAPGEPVAYRPADRSFSADLPSDWKVDEGGGESGKAAFFGPPSGPKPYSQLIGVYFHASATPDASARAFLAAEASGDAPFAPREVAVGALKGLELVASRVVPDVHAGPQRVTTRVVAVPVANGFWTLEQTWPTGTEAAPAFDRVLSTFRPAAGTK